MSDHSVTVRLEPEWLEMLERFGRQRDLTVEQVIRVVILSRFPDLEKTARDETASSR